MESGFATLLQQAPATLPRGPHGFTREEVEASQRNRMMVALIELSAERGFHDVTVQDIVREAGTAKGAFYASFADKEDCFVQTFDMAAEMIVNAVVEAVSAVEDPTMRTVVGVRTYLGMLIDSPALVQIFSVESVGAGDKLTLRWRHYIELLARAVVEWREESRVNHPQLQRLSANPVTAIISGINQLAWITAQRDGMEALRERTDEFVTMTIAMLAAPFDTASEQLA